MPKTMTLVFTFLEDGCMAILNDEDVVLSGTESAKMVCGFLLYAESQTNYTTVKFGIDQYMDGAARIQEVKYVEEQPNPAGD